MANGRQVDTTLVIKARDEASRAIKAIDKLMADFASTQQSVAAGSVDVKSGIAQLVSGLAGLDRAYANVTAAQNAASAATERQQNALSANKAQLAALQSQLESARASQQRFNEQVGPPTQQATQRYSAVAQAVKELETQIKAAERAVATQEGQFQRSTSTLAELERAERLAGATATFAKQQTEDYTQALSRQNAEAERAARLQSTIARNTDSRTGYSAEDSASAFRAAGLTDYERQAAQAEKLAQAERDYAASAELANNALRYRARLGGGDTGQPVTRAGDTAFADQLREEDKAATAAAAAVASETAAIARLRSELNPLAAIQDRLNKELAEADRWYTEGKISAEELAAAQNLLRASADRAAQQLGQQTAGGGKPSLFGLKPYELQNLGYQVNDVFTQLASGTDLMQTLAQQGGQILQIFPRVGSTLIAAFKNPYILAAVATVGTLITALNQYGNQLERIRQFQAQLAGSADGDAYNAQALNAAAEAMDRYGGSAKEAVDAVQTFVSNGVRADMLDEFGRAAQNVAQITGKDLKTAVEEVTKAFTGGYDAIVDINESYNFLTSTQLDYIRTLYEEGKAGEARVYALNQFSGKQQEVADKMRGPWSSAVRELGMAWNDFLKWLGNLKPIKAVSGAINDLGNEVAKLIRSLRGAENEGELVSKLARLRQRRNSMAGSVGNGASILQIITGNTMGELNDLDRQIAEIEGRLKKMRDDAAAGANATDTTDQNSNAARNRRNQRLQEMEREDELDKLRKKGEKGISAAEEARREYLAGQIAYNKEIFDSGDAILAQAEKQNAIEAEGRKIDEERVRLGKQRATEAEREARERRRANIEAIRDNGREEVLATAKRFDGYTEGRNRAQIEKFLRDNGVNIDNITEAGQLVKWCAAFVNAVLKENNLPGTGSLRAKDFAGYGEDASSNPQNGDIVVLNRPGGGHVGFFQGFDDKGNVRVLGGNQSQGVNTQTFNSRDVVAIRRMPSRGQVVREELQAEERVNKSREQYNEQLDVTLRERAIDTQNLTGQLALQDRQLLAAQKRAQVEEAVRRATDEAKKAKVDTESEDFKARIARLREVEGAYFDASHARDTFEMDRRTVDDPVNQLTTLRDRLQEQIRFAQERGQTGIADQLGVQLAEVNSRLTDAIAKAKEFYAALSDNPVAMAALGLTKDEISNIQLGLDVSARSGQNLGYVMGIAGETIAQTFASTATNAIDRFAQAVAAGKNVFSSLKDAFLSFAADFLRQIAQMIIQQIIFNAVSNFMKSQGFGAPSGGLPGFGGGTGSFGQSDYGLISKIFHDGGVVGAGGASRAVSASVFAGAGRFHDGGLPGLKQNEVAAVLQKGEEVLTADDPRHIGNGGGQQAAPSWKIINTLDPGEFISKGLNTAAGEKAILNWMRANSAAVRSAQG